MRFGISLDLDDGVTVVISFEHICWIRVNKAASSSVDDKNTRAIVHFRDGSGQEIVGETSVALLTSRYLDYLYRDPRVR